jgi:hypothetical protein
VGLVKKTLATSAKTCTIDSIETKQGKKMPKSTITATDTVRDLVDALRERQVEEYGYTYADASAFTLGYISSMLGGFIDTLTPKAKAAMIQDITCRLSTVQESRVRNAQRRSSASATL